MSTDPLQAKFPYQSPYVFAGNDVIRSIDFGGLAKLIMTNVNQDKMTATITIQKDIQIINAINLPDKYKNIDKNEVYERFEKGNTILYVEALPVNGSPVRFTNKRKWKKGKAYALEVIYDVKVDLIEPSQQYSGADGDNGRISNVFVGVTSQFLDRYTEAIATADPTNYYEGYGNTTVYIHPNPHSRESSAAAIITHEIGIHNMAQMKHIIGHDGGPIYPQKPGLESNNPAYIYPVNKDTERIINVNLQEGRLDQK